MIPVERLMVLLIEKYAPDFQCRMLTWTESFAWPRSARRDTQGVVVMLLFLLAKA